MRDERFSIAGNGLKLMFIGQLAALCSFVPLVGGLAALIGGVISIVGLVKTIHADRGYQRALVMLVLSVAAGVLMVVMAAVAAGGAMFGSGAAAAGGIVAAGALTVAMSVFSFLQIYFVCAATSGLLREIGADAEASLGDLVWKLNALIYLIIIAVNLFLLLFPVASALLSLVNTLAGVAAGVLYVVFLYKSHTVMLAS